MLYLWVSSSQTLSTRSSFNDFICPPTFCNWNLTFFFKRPQSTSAFFFFFFFFLDQVLNSTVFINQRWTSATFGKVEKKQHINWTDKFISQNPHNAVIIQMCSQLWSAAEYWSPPDGREKFDFFFFFFKSFNLYDTANGTENKVW